VTLTGGLQPPVERRFQRRRAFLPRLQKLHEELVVAHFLAFSSVEALEQGGDKPFLDGELGL
jgi:hypothetical protein